jgi:hypothetical protein
MFHRVKSHDNLAKVIALLQESSRFTIADAEEATGLPNHVVHSRMFGWIANGWFEKAGRSQNDKTLYGPGWKLNGARKPMKPGSVEARVLARARTMGRVHLDTIRDMLEDKSPGQAFKVAMKLVKHRWLRGVGGDEYVPAAEPFVHESVIERVEDAIAQMRRGEKRFMAKKVG